MTKDSPRRVPPNDEDTGMDGNYPSIDDHSGRVATARMTTQAVYGDVPAYDVRGLMRKGQTAHLVLDGQTYCLRITRAGKLILTK